MTKQLPEAVKDRLKAIRTDLRKLPAQGLLVTDMVNVRYLSGFTGTEASLLITKRGQYILADSRYATQAGRQAKGYSVYKTGRRMDDVKDLVKKVKIESMAFEPEGMTHAYFLDLKKLLRGVTLVPLGGAIRRLRAVKDKNEGRHIKRAADIAFKAFHDIVNLARPGMREDDFAITLETRMRNLGSEEAGFHTIVASGPRGALPHGVATDRKMKEGELVTVDFGATFKGYRSDQTITFCVGKPKPRQRLIYKTVLEAHDRAIEAAGPGLKCKDLDKVARDIIGREGFGKYFGHGLGHGVGLEVHEAPSLNPRSETVLEAGNVITIEPGIYIPGYGGCRIEDMVLVTEKGGKVLTKSGGPLREI